MVQVTHRAPATTHQALALLAAIRLCSVVHSQVTIEQVSLINASFDETTQRGLSVQATDLLLQTTDLPVQTTDLPFQTTDLPVQTTDLTVQTTKDLPTKKDEPLQTIVLPVQTIEADVSVQLNRSRDKILNADPIPGSTVLNSEPETSTKSSGSNFADNVNTQYDRKTGSLQRLVCTFDSTAPSRTGQNRFLIQNMSASVCTDLYYEHAVITDDTSGIKAISKLDIFPLDGNMYIPSYVAINDFKVKSPGLRTFLTIVESPKTSFSDFPHGSGKLKSFVRSCLKQARIWGFDGININWRRLPSLGSLVNIIGHMRVAFDAEVTLQKLPKLLLGVSIFGDIRQFHDLEEASHLNGLVDQLTLLAFNLADEGATVTQLMSPLYPPRRTEKIKAIQSAEWPTDTSLYETARKNDINSGDRTTADSTEEGTNVTVENAYGEERISPRTNWGTPSHGVNLKEALEALHMYGVSKSKINVGISLTGQSYTLKDKGVNGIGAPVQGLGNIFDKVGQVYFSDMCKVATGQKLRASAEDDTPYWYNDHSWVSYEDLRSIRQKIEYVLDKHVGGITLISQSEDDFTGEACGAGPFPASRLLYNLSSVDLHLNHYEYSFPWAEYCGPGTAVVADWRLVAHSAVLSFLAAVWLGCR